MTARQLFLKTILAYLALNLCAVAPVSGQVDSQKEPPILIRKSGSVFQSSATMRVEPTYPPLAKAARISGSVVIEVTTNEQGEVISVRPISGHPLLKDSAAAAARGWKFSPTQLGGVPVTVIGTIRIRSKISGGPMK